MNNTEAIEGIILATFAFEESSHIVSLISKEYGRVKCVHKNYKKNQMRALSALLGVELLVIPSEKELWKCRDCQVVTSYPQLRLRRATLQFAAEITDLLDKLLPLHLAVPGLFTLYQEFLHHLPHFTHPETAAALFLAKFAAMEGIMNISSGFDKKSFEEQYSVLPEPGYYQKLLYEVRK